MQNFFRSKFIEILIDHDSTTDILYLCAALQNRMYDMAGRFIAYSIVHNGPLPTFFNRHLYTAISEGCSYAVPDVCDISELDMQLQLRKVTIHPELAQSLCFLTLQLKLFAF